MTLALSRAVYHALAAATSDARSYGYPQVTGVHLIAAFLNDPATVVSRAHSAQTTGASIKARLIAFAPSPPHRAPETLPVGFAPDVRNAFLTEKGENEPVSTGDVLLRLLDHPDTPTSVQLGELGLDLSGLRASAAALLERGERDSE